MSLPALRLFDPRSVVPESSYSSFGVFGESVFSCTSACTFLSCDYIIAHLFLFCNMQIAQSIQIFFVYIAEFRCYDEFSIDILIKV